MTSGSEHEQSSQPGEPVTKILTYSRIRTKTMAKVKETADASMTFQPIEGALQSRITPGGGFREDMVGNSSNSQLGFIRTEL